MRQAYSAHNCTDTVDVLTAVTVHWERAGKSLSELLARPKLLRQVRALSRRYALLEAREIEAGTFAHIEKCFDVPEFEHLFDQLNP